MSRFLIYLLAFMMSAAIVSSRKMPIPRIVNHADRQCVERGHLGVCMDTLHLSTTINCNNLECASKIRNPSRNHRAMSTGRAADGTHCGTNKVCFSGECINLPSGVTMPRQILENPEAYICYHPNSISSPSV